MSSARRSSTTPAASVRCASSVGTTASPCAKPSHATVYVTGTVDLAAMVIVDLVEGSSAADLRRWTGNADEDWLGAARWWPPTWPSRSGPAVAASDPGPPGGGRFHVVRVGRRGVDQVRRRVPNETRGTPGPQGPPALSDPVAVRLGPRAPRRAGVERMLLGLRLGAPRDEVLGA